MDYSLKFNIDIKVTYTAIVSLLWKFEVSACLLPLKMLTVLMSSLKGKVHSNIKTLSHVSGKLGEVFYSTKHFCSLKDKQCCSILLKSWSRRFIRFWTLQIIKSSYQIRTRKTIKRRFQWVAVFIFLFMFSLTSQYEYHQHTELFMKLLA